MKVQLAVRSLLLFMSMTASAAAIEGSADDAFKTVREVLQHPRCQNCHIPGDAPLQFDAGTTHSMNVKRGKDGKGVEALPCSSCHGEANLAASYGPHVPPGAPTWHLPPAAHKMVFIGKSAADLCEGLKDTSENGGKDLAALLKHVTSDGLVLWGWNPGQGRQAVPIPHEQFVAAFKAWIDDGAPCPK